MHRPQKHYEGSTGIFLLTIWKFSSDDPSGIHWKYTVDCPHLGQDVPWLIEEDINYFVADEQIVHHVVRRIQAKISGWHVRFEDLRIAEFSRLHS